MGAVGVAQPSPGAPQRPRQPGRLGARVIPARRKQKELRLFLPFSLSIFKNIIFFLNLEKSLFCTFIPTSAAESFFTARSGSLLSAFLCLIPL